MMAGTNGPDPALLYWAPGHPPAEGAMVLTSAVGGAFPPGLPVGVVHYDGQNDPVVLPLADLASLRLLRLFSYPVSLPQLTPIPHEAERLPRMRMRASRSAGVEHGRRLGADGARVHGPADRLVAATRRRVALRVSGRDHDASACSSSACRSACPARRSCGRFMPWPACISGRSTARPRCRRRWWRLPGCCWACSVSPRSGCGRCCCWCCRA